MHSRISRNSAETAAWQTNLLAFRLDFFEFFIARMHISAKNSTPAKTLDLGFVCPCMTMGALFALTDYPGWP